MLGQFRALRSSASGLAAGLIRACAPDSRTRQLRAELRFWRHWVATKGSEWPDDFAMRFDLSAPVQEHLRAYIDTIPATEVDILDVGSGPATKLGKTYGSKRLSITAVDVLAHEYGRLLAEFGFSPPVTTQYADCQALRRQFGNRRFDIVYAENSLDHMSEPLEAIREMLAVTKPGGFVILLHRENEGKNQSYEDLHKWDFTCENRHFVIRGPGPKGTRTDITKLLSPLAQIESRFYEGDVFVTMRRRSATPSRDDQSRTSPAR